MAQLRIKPAFTAMVASLSLSLPVLAQTVATSSPRQQSMSLSPASSADRLPVESAPASPIALTPQTLDRLHAPILRSDLKLLGAQSCAAASCHGGPHPGVAQPWLTRGSEFPLWFEKDPHALSWRTISSPASVAMMQRLKIMRGNEIVDQAGFDNCLACHNTTKRFHEPRSSEARNEGVGCSGCHGPEELWNGNHYQYGFDPLNSTEVGFVANGDLLTRARTCAACHVGDKDRDMNHDIIAAGHPALRYELTTFHAWQPKHWRDTEASDKTFYEAQLWLAGQIAAADAALSLLQARSVKSHTASEWPELSAYDCSSCHHSLGLNNTRRTPTETSDRVNRTQAIAPLSMWNFAGLVWVLRYRVEQNEATDEDLRLLSSLEQVQVAMEAGATPNSNDVSNAVTEARLAIAAWVDGTAGQSERANFRSDRLGRIAASAAGKTASFDTWETAVQLYLAAVAARESWPEGPSGSLHDIAESLRRGLAYPNQTNSPEFATRKSRQPVATREEARQTTLELVRWLGPVVTDDEPLPAQDEPSPEEAKREIELLLEQVGKAAKDKSQSTPATPVKPVAPGIQPAAPMEKPPVKPPVVRPPVKPKPELTPEERLKQLEALQGDDADL
jgi:hypothetical protein